MSDGHHTRSRVDDNSGQWCMIHDCHQDDPEHAYEYLVCEGHHRDATVEENAQRDRKAHATPDRVATAQVTTDEHGNYVVKMGTHLLHHTYGQTWEARRDATLVCQGANRALDRIRMAT